MANKQQTVLGKISERILSGEFVSGAFLPCEQVLTEEYGFSRVTIRAALQKLVEQKILKTIPYKGYQVINVPSQPLPDVLNIGALWCSNVLHGYAYNLYLAAKQVAEVNRYGLFVKSSDDDSRGQAALLSELLEFKTDGLLIVPTFDPAGNYMTLGNHALFTLLRKAGKPLVLLDRDFPETDLPCVLNDEYGGGNSVAEHLAAHGHRRIAVFVPDISYYIQKQRVGGLLDGCGKHGIKTFCFSLPKKDFLNLERTLFYKKYRQDLLDFAKANKVTAIFVNVMGIYEKFLKDFDGLGFDIVLYDTDIDVPTKSNVWRVERPIEKIAVQATALLLDEIRRRASGPAVQVRLKPAIKALPEK